MCPNDLLLVELVELIAPHVRQSRTLVGAHKGPVPVRLHPLHEEVRDPEGVEEVTGAILLLSRVLLAVEEGKDVCVPRLQVDGKRPRALINNKTYYIIEGLKFRQICFLSQGQVETHFTSPCNESLVTQLHFKEYLFVGN